MGVGPRICEVMWHVLDARNAERQAPPFFLIYDPLHLAI